MRLAVLFLIPALVGAAEPAKLPEPFRSLADLATAAPPEFTADALLRIVESGKLADKAFRHQLLEHAFQLAAAAKFPVRMMVVPAGVTDTRSGSLSEAYALKLDALSLQSRAVRDMLPLDPSMGRELFGQMTKPTLGPLTCDDALGYEPSDFYQALGAVVNSGFTPKEKAKEEHFNLLVDALGLVTSPSQLAPLAQAIEGSGVTPAQHQILSARFNGLLENIQPDERSYSASLPTLFAINTPEIQPSLAKYREKNHGCETDGGAHASRTPSPQDDPPSESAPPSDPAPRPAKRPSTPKLELYWQSSNAQQLLEAGKKLRFSSNTEPYTDAERATTEWQQQLADYLNLIAQWTSDQESSDAVYYHEKCLVYTGLLDLVPAGSQSDKILADYVDFIGKSSLYQQSPAEWFVEPHMLLDRAEHDNGQRTKVLDAYQSSGNPVLALEVALEKTLRAH